MLLVSGGSGLVGSYLLLSLIDQGESLRAIYRNENSLKKAKWWFKAMDRESDFEKIDWFQADILDLPNLSLAFEGVERVIHSAAKVSFQKGDQNDLYKVNVEGTANMVNLALQKEVKRFIYVSSVAALGKDRHEECSSEESSWQHTPQTSDYSVSKFYAENEVWRASIEGLKVGIINPSTIIGFGDWEQSSNAIFKHVNKGIPFYPPGSNGFVGVEDVVQSIVLLLNSTIENERFLISSANISYQKLFREIAKGLHKKPPTLELKLWQAKLFLIWSSLKSWFIKESTAVSRASIRTAFSQRCFNNQKAQEELKMKFTPIEESIEKASEIYRRVYDL